MDRRRGRARWMIVGLCVAALLGGCGDITIPIPGLGDPATPTPAAQPTAVVKIGTTTAQIGGQLPSGFPTSFPLPQGYQLQSAADDGRQMTVVLGVPAAQAAYDFYKQALPGAGYQVRELGTTTTGGAFSGGLAVTGNGFNGEVAVTAVGSAPLVSIRLERGGAITPGGPTPGQANVPTVAAKPGQPPAATVTTKPSQNTAPSTGTLPASFPTTFPLPPQYQVQSASDDGRQAAVVISVQSAQAAYDFYKGVLPLSGYQVKEEGAPRSGSGIFSGALSFTGQGQSGMLAFSTAGPTHLVTISLERGAATTPPGGATPAVSASPPAAPTPVAKPAAPTPSASSGLPAGFPLPPQAQVQVSTDDGHQIAVVLGVPVAKDAFEFYKGALPGAGYQVSDANGIEAPGGAFGGAIRITGNGVSGELAFAGTPAGHTVAIRLERSGGAAATAPAKPAAATAPAKPAAVASPGVSTGPAVGGLPPGFPLPPEHRVQASADSGRQVAVVLVVPSVQAAYEFYKQALPGAGYEVNDRGVTTTPGGAFNGSIGIRGNGVAGEVVCTATAGTNIVAISLNRT